MNYKTEILLKACADSRLSPRTTHLADVIYEWKLAGLPDANLLISGRTLMECEAWVEKMEAKYKVRNYYSQITLRNHFRINELTNELEYTGGGW
jgi:hypothetical protein